jgi:hypothetical protein
MLLKQFFATMFNDSYDLDIFLQAINLTTEKYFDVLLYFVLWIQSVALNGKNDQTYKRYILLMHLGTYSYFFTQYVNLIYTHIYISILSDFKGCLNHGY